MSNPIIEDTNFKEKDYTETALAQGSYDNCAFLNCDFANSNINKSTFLECTFENCDFSMAAMKTLR